MWDFIVKYWLECVGTDEGMHLEGDIVFVLVEQQVFEVVLDLVDVENGGADFAFAVAHGAFLLHLHFGGGAHTLAGDLDEAKLGGGEDGVFGTVEGHLLAQHIKELLAMGRLVHVDDVDDDDTAHVAETQLAGDFLSRLDIDDQGVFFLGVFLVDSMAAIDVDDVHGLGVFDDEVVLKMVIIYLLSSI